ncbi:hypothetical protein LGM46_13425 [Burkholderia arboris]|uniref:hypothetical protein n=1 Tax=Burkholderia arboris TaxID=488730 RepID=UPI001CF2FC64|nr:hypothetical protein [Burkholderia arboris]MCA8033976.1 hypothetical protein [Burkholderia arboris]
MNTHTVYLKNLADFALTFEKPVSASPVAVVLQMVRIGQFAPKLAFGTRRVTTFQVCPSRASTCLMSSHPARAGTIDRSRILWEFERKA